MNKNTAVSWVVGKAIFYCKSIVLKDRIRDQMSARIAHTYQHAIANEERIFCRSVRIHFRNVSVPTGEIFPVEQTKRYLLLRFPENSSRHEQNKEDVPLHEIDLFYLRRNLLHFSSICLDELDLTQKLNIIVEKG